MLFCHLNAQGTENEKLETDLQPLVRLKAIRLLNSQGPLRTADFQPPPPPILNIKELDYLASLNTVISRHRHECLVSELLWTLTKDHVSGQSEFRARLGSFDQSPKSYKEKGGADIGQWYSICLCSRLVTKQGRGNGLNEMSLMLSSLILSLWLFG